jgi:hypothetical protein
MMDVVPRRLKLPSKPLGAKTNGFKNKKKINICFIGGGKSNLEYY